MMLTLIGFVVIFIIRIKMGCGAICGDSAAVESATLYNIATYSMQILIPVLNKTSPLSTRKSSEAFIQMYRQDTKKFHLFARPQIAKGEQVPEEVLFKWKFVLFALDSDQKNYSNCLGLPQLTNQQSNGDPQVPSSISNVPEPLIFHQCFLQIDKDLDRTFALPEGKRREFQNVLKRIANFFPKMGYTQGINFVVGYLIIVGYSQNDSFWIFVHIAINRRYLLLGLYEDGFPLSNVLIIIFKNVLKRTNDELYMHLFQVLGVDPSLWVFKWFITCYTRTFPLEMVKYAWDVMIQLGSIGIVTFAVSLTRQLSPFLIMKEEMSDVDEFLQSLKSVKEFNNFVNMERVVKGAFQFEIVLKDFEGVEEFGGFYGVYFKESFYQLQKHLVTGSQMLPKFSQVNSKSQVMLDRWYQNLLDQRITFQKNNKTQNTLQLPLLLQSNEKPIRRSESGDIQIKIYSYEQDSTSPGDGKARRGSMDMGKNDSKFEVKCNIKKIEYNFDKINQKMQEESRSERSKKSIPRSIAKKSHQSQKGISNSRVMQQFDELDKLQQQFDKKSKKSVKINNYAVAPELHKRAKLKKGEYDGGGITIQNGVANFKITSQKSYDRRNTFAIAGQNAVKIQSYDASVSSVSSKRVSSKQGLQIPANMIRQPTSQSKTGRSCACKMKTEQNKLSSFDRNSELASSKDQFSDKDSVDNRNKSHNEQSMGEIPELHRVTTHVDYMVNSHGPTMKMGGMMEEQQRRRRVEGQTEVEVLPFKKAKKMNEGKVSHIEVIRGETPSVRGRFEHEEESIESINPCSLERISHLKCGGDCERYNGNSCEVESIR